MSPPLFNIYPEDGFDEFLEDSKDEIITNGTNIKNIPYTDDIPLMSTTPDKHQIQDDIFAQKPGDNGPASFPSNFSDEEEKNCDLILFIKVLLVIGYLLRYFLEFDPLYFCSKKMKQPLQKICINPQFKQSFI